MPRILREIIERAVAGQPDMEIVDDLPPEGIAPEALRRAGADVVISGGRHRAAATRAGGALSRPCTCGDFGGAPPLARGHPAALRPAAAEGARRLGRRTR